MPSPLYPNPFVIRPPADLLTTYPDLGRAAGALARAHARGDYVTDEGLQAMGRALWTALDQTLDLANELEAARAAASPHILPIVIASDTPAIHQLPWETLHHSEYGFLGKADGFALIRQPIAARTSLPPVEKGPLRVLVFTSLPDDLDTGSSTAASSRLDVEEEQAQLLEALTPWVAEGQIALTMPNDGTFATFQRLLKETQPHLVFLSGHGKFIDPVGRDEEPYAIFQFENEAGGSNFIDGKSLASAFVGTSVECVILSACESGMGGALPPSNLPQLGRETAESSPEPAEGNEGEESSSDALMSGLTWRLSQLGIPHVIGMRESVLDRAGTLFARAVCDAVAARELMPVALQRGRQAITTPLAGSVWLRTDSDNASGDDSETSAADSGLAEGSLGQWALPMLITHAPSRPLIDWDFTPAPKQDHLSNQTLNTISLPPRFIGRRSELRDLQGRLRNGTLYQLLITGPGGQGKTALAGKLAQDLERQGYQILAFSARPENTWLDFQLELELLLTLENTQRYTHMVARYEQESDRAFLLLRLLMQQFDNKIVLFFDNLESLQDPTSQALQTDSEIGANVTAWIAAAQNLVNQNRAAAGLILLLTSRWRLPDWPVDDASSLHWALDRIDYGDFLQMALQLGEQGQLPRGFLRQRDRLRQVHQTLHGNGRGLVFFAGALQEIVVSGVTQEAQEEQEEEFRKSLAEAEAEVQTDMALSLLLEHLPPEPTALLQRLPVYLAPVPVEGIKKIGLDLPHQPEELLARLLAVSLVEQAYAHDLQTPVYLLSPLVADWLRENDAPEPSLELRRAAADYQAYLFRHERRTLSQAMVVHQALDQAEQVDARDRFALDYIVGRLNRAGLYQTLLTEWLPPICESTNRQIEGEAMVLTGNQYYHVGDYETALKYLEQSLAIQKEIGDKAHEGGTLNNISQIYDARGDYERALKYLEQSLAISQEIGDKAGEGTTLNNMATTAHARGDTSTALKYLEQSLAISQEIGDKSGEGTTLNNMATTAHARGDYETALKYLEQSLAIRQEIGDVAGLCATLFNMGHIYLQNEEPQQAVGAWVTVYRLASQMNLAQVLQALSGLADSLGLEGGLEGWAKLAAQMEEPPS